MSKKIVIAAALALVMVGISATGASAACSPPKGTGTYNTVTGVYTYWTTTIPQAGATLVAKIWSPGGDHTGTCNTLSTSPGPGILYWGGAPGTVGMKLGLGDACVVGCPSGSLSILPTVIGAGGQTQQLIQKKAEETPAGGLNFDFSTAGGTMCDMPCPTVLTSSAVDATHKSVTLGVAAIPAGCITDPADILGWKIVSKASATDPGNDASAYTAVATLAAPGGGAAQGKAVVDCSDPTKDQWVTMQLNTTGGGAPSVCKARRVNCDPRLADPKFNRIPPKKGVAPAPTAK